MEAPLTSERLVKSGWLTQQVANTRKHGCTQEINFCTSGELNGNIFGNAVCCVLQSSSFCCAFLFATCLGLGQDTGLVCLILTAYGCILSSPLEPSALVDLLHGSSCASCPYYQGVPESVFFIFGRNVRASVLNSGPVPTAGNTSHCAIGPPLNIGLLTKNTTMFRALVKTLQV